MQDAALGGKVATMNLRLICTARYIPSNLNIRADKTKKNYQYALNNLRDVLGREPELSDLNEETMTRYMSTLLSWGLAERTVNNRWDCMRALWAWCARRNLVETWPTVKKIQEPQRIPRAWTLEQLGRLMEASEKYTKKIGGVRGSDWWRAFHAFIWDSSERAGAALKIRWEWLDFETGVLHVPAEARKRRQKDAVYQLQPDTLTALRIVREQTTSPLMFPGIKHISSFYRRYDVLLEKAGLPGGRYNKTQKVRRSHATYLKLNGGDPTQSLQHSSDAVTRRHYIDPSICGDTPSAKLQRILPDRFNPKPPDNDDHRRTG